MQLAPEISLQTKKTMTCEYLKQRVFKKCDTTTTRPVSDSPENLLFIFICGHGRLSQN